MDTEFIKAIVGVGGAAFILGLLTVFKPFLTDHRWVPVIALVLGLVINMGAAWGLANGIMTPVQWITSAFQGIIGGMAASGFYSGGQEIIRGGQ